ncbi:DeoR/GlpR family DNA-binding transcription regulator [Yokenella regensburgei]|uniref:DeoR/GlpR family DNA-binding transcription regulator n=1 Tax=Yokenella regensburgei TaxID=158877 RepID=UPI003EDA0C30
MRNHIRRQHIVNEVNQAHSVSVKQLATQFQVSVETVRRDLAWLEKMGRLVRIHGGTRTLLQDDVGELFKKRRNERTEAKTIMAHKALGMIERHMTIGLDASSSDWFLARLLPDIPLTVVTNSMEVVKELSSRNHIHIVCTGGDYCCRYADFIGDMAQRNLRSQHIHISFVSCFGVNLLTGLWENSELNALTKRTMIKMSQKAVLLADSSKYGRRSLYNMADWSNVKYVINDGQLDAEALARFSQLGVTVI